jgi:RNA polymerase sigma-70 factor (ECF subfamily)
MTRVGSFDLVELHPNLTTSDMTDEALIAACATGDRASQARLFERHVDAIHRFVTRMRGTDHEMIEDLVQSTFLAAFQSARRFRGGNVRAWLYGIAANHVRNYARREVRRKRALVAVADVAPALAGGGDPSLAAYLPAAIEALPHDLRAALVLIDLEGELGRDAALALGVPEGTLWRRVHLARKAVRVALGGEP